MICFFLPFFFLFGELEGGVIFNIQNELRHKSCVSIFAGLLHIIFKFFFHIQLMLQRSVNEFPHKSSVHQFLVVFYVSFLNFYRMQLLMLQCAINELRSKKKSCVCQFLLVFYVSFLIFFRIQLMLQRSVHSEYPFFYVF